MSVQYSTCNELSLESYLEETVCRMNEHFITSYSPLLPIQKRNKYEMKLDIIELNYLWLRLRMPRTLLYVRQRLYEKPDKPHEILQNWAIYIYTNLITNAVHVFYLHLLDAYIPLEFSFSDNLCLGFHCSSDFRFSLKMCTKLQHHKHKTYKINIIIIKQHKGMYWFKSCLWIIVCNCKSDFLFSEYT